MQKRLNRSTIRHTVLNEDSVGPRNHILDGGADPPRGRGNFRGCPGYSKTWTIFAAPVAAASLQQGSFNHQQRHAAEKCLQYARQAQIVFRIFLGAGDAFYRPRRGGGIAHRGRSLISTITLLY